MENTLTKYSHGALTVVWQPHKCIHAGHCFRGLADVFNPRLEPWVHPENATTDRIIDQVRKCPSGALSYYLSLEADYGEESTSTATTIGTVIEATLNGPLLVYGDLCVRKPDGDIVQGSGITAFCRCGASGKKPYCDGSHNRVGFKG